MTIGEHREHREHPSEAQLLLALDGELDARDAALVSDHVRGCAACRAASDRLATLSGEVERYCRSWPPEPAVAASAPARDVPPWQRSRRERVLSRSAALAAAAAVLLAIGAGWILRSRASTSVGPQAAIIPIMPTPTRTSDIQLASANANGSEPAAASAGKSPGIGVHQHVEVRLPTSVGAPTQPSNTRTAATPRRAELTPATAIAAATRRPARAQTLQASAQRTPTYYWSLPYSNHALPLSEGAVVMRVRLSRDQLRLAGIPVSDLHIADRDQSLVRAKVLVGADGLPRAISFDQD